MVQNLYNSGQAFGHYGWCVNPGINPNRNTLPVRPFDISAPHSLLSGDFSGPNKLLLLTPAIFGSAAAFILGFGFYGRNLTAGYTKYIFFTNIYALITSLGVGTFVYAARENKTTVAEVILPASLLMFFYGTVFNLTYSLYPETFSGTIGSTPLSQFLSFLSMGVANVSVGETLDVVPKKPGVQVLLSITGLFSLFVLGIIISMVT